MFNMTNAISFIKSHNLVNRVYDMLCFFNIIKNIENKNLIQKSFLQNLMNIEYVESLAKYFEKKLKENQKNIDLKCNLKDLIYDLNYLKQYLS